MFSFSNWWRKEFYFTFCLMTADGLRHMGEKFHFTDTCRDEHFVAKRDTVYELPTHPLMRTAFFRCFNCRICMRNIFSELHEYDMSTFIDVGTLLAVAK